MSEIDDIFAEAQGLGIARSALDDMPEGYTIQAHDSPGVGRTRTNTDGWPEKVGDGFLAKRDGYVILPLPGKCCHLCKRPL